MNKFLIAEILQREREKVTAYVSLQRKAVPCIRFSRW